MLRLNPFGTQNTIPYILNADDKKPPKGFEKFFKKKNDKESSKSKFLIYG